MSAACSVETLRQVPDNTTLEWGRGEEFKCGERTCFKPVLKSINGEEIASSPGRTYYFRTEGSDKESTFEFFSKTGFDLDKFAVERDNLFLKAEKDSQGELKLSFCDRDGNIIKSEHYGISDVEESDIIGSINGSIDFEKYLNIDKPQLMVITYPTSCNNVHKAILVDVSDEYSLPVGEFVETIAYYVDGSSLINFSSIYGEGTMSSKEPTVIIGKINDQYRLSILDDGQYRLILNSGQFSTLRVKDLKVNYDMLNKVMDEVLCNQIEIANKEKEALCKELDEASMLMSEEHHKCVSELAKANFIMDQATYDTDTYM